MKPITTGFNIIATLALMTVWSLMDGLFENIPLGHSLIDRLIDSVWGQLAVWVMIFIVAALVTAKVVEQIWNRFISDVFQKRNITQNEAYSLCLLLSVLLM